MQYFVAGAYSVDRWQAVGLAPPMLRAGDLAATVALDDGSRMEIILRPALKAPRLAETAIVAAYERNGYNAVRTGRELGMSTRMMFYHLRAFGVPGRRRQRGVVETRRCRA